MWNVWLMKYWTILNMIAPLTSCTSFRRVMKLPKCHNSTPNLSAHDFMLFYTTKEADGDQTTGTRNREKSEKRNGKKNTRKITFVLEHMCVAVAQFYICLLTAYAFIIYSQALKITATTTQTQTHLHTVLDWFWFAWLNLPRISDEKW